MCNLRGPGDSAKAVLGGLFLCGIPSLYLILTLSSAIGKFFLTCFLFLCSFLSLHNPRPPPHLKLHVVLMALFLSSFFSCLLSPWTQLQRCDAVGGYPPNLSHPPFCDPGIVDGIQWWSGRGRKHHCPMHWNRIHPPQPLFGLVFPFVIVHSTQESDPSWCCWSGSDASAMGGIQFCMITNAILYIPTLLCIGSMYMEIGHRKRF